MAVLRIPGPTAQQATTACRTNPAKLGVTGALPDDPLRDAIGAALFGIAPRHALTFPLAGANGASAIRTKSTTPHLLPGATCVLGAPTRPIQPNGKQRSTGTTTRRAMSPSCCSGQTANRPVWSRNLRLPDQCRPVPTATVVAPSSSTLNHRAPPHRRPPPDPRRSRRRRCRQGVPRPRQRLPHQHSVHSQHQPYRRPAKPPAWLPASPPLRASRAQRIRRRPAHHQNRSRPTPEPTPPAAIK